MRLVACCFAELACPVPPRMCYRRLLGNCVTCPKVKSNMVGYLIILVLFWVIVNVSFARSVEHLMVGECSTPYSRARCERRS
jgi:hypothetical protein